MRRRRTSTLALAVIAVVAALGAWSCGGPLESPTGVAAITSTGEDGVVGASKADKVTVCHKGKELRVAASALVGHLAHGDRLGSCAAVCPCFTSEGLAQVASLCSVPPIATCGDPYSINLYCAPGGGGGTISSLGLFQARLGTNTCSTTTQDLMTGEEITITLLVTAAEFEGCRQAIVQNPYYPPSCPM